MAWAHNATSYGYNTDTSLDFSHTVGAGANRILVVEVGMLFPFEDGQVTAMTYNGVACTKIRGDNGGGGVRTELWYLIAPDSGSHTLHIEFDGTYLGFGNDGLFAGCSDYTGIAQTSPVRSSGTEPDSGLPGTVVGTDGDLMAATVYVDSGVGDMNLSASQNERWDQTYAAGGDKIAVASGSYGWTNSGFTYASFSYAMLIPAASGPTEKDVSDTLTPRLDEASAIQAGNAVTESLLPKTTEAAEIQANVDPADSILPKVDEAVDLLADTPVTDDLTPRLDSEILLELTEHVETTVGFLASAMVSRGAAFWGGIANALASDDAYAISPDTGPTVGAFESNYLTVTNPDVVIPPTATNFALALHIERHQDDGGGTGWVKDLLVYLIKSGVIQTGLNRADTGTTWPDSDGVADYGGDDWGFSDWDDGDFGSGMGFALAVQMDSGSATIEALVDAMRMTLTYEVPLSLVLKEAVDTLTVALSESVDITTFLEAFEDLLLYTDETAVINLLKLLSVTDSLPILITDAAEIVAALSLTDTLTPKTDEAVSDLSVALSVTEQLNPTLADVADLVAAFSVADTVSPKTTEATPAIQAALDVGDDLTPKTTETASLVGVLVEKEVSDDLTPSLAETVAILVSFSVADTISPEVTESTGSQAAASLADTLSLTLEEEMATLAALTAADTLGVRADALATVFIDGAAAETLKVKVLEALSVFVSFEVTEDILVKLNDTASLSGDLLAQSATESLAILLQEVAAILVAQGIEDDLTIALQDAADVVAALGVADSLAVLMSETSTVLAMATGADTLSPKLQEQVAIQIATDLADSLALTCDEAANVTAAITVADTLYIFALDEAEQADRPFRSGRPRIILRAGKVQRIETEES